MKNFTGQLKIFSIVLIIDIIWELYECIIYIMRIPSFHWILYDWTFYVFIGTPLLGLTGSIISFTSSFKKNSLLILFLSIRIIAIPIILLDYCHFLAKKPDLFDITAAKVPLSIHIIICTELAIYIFFIYAFGLLCKHKKARIDTINYETGTVHEIVLANRKQRFINRLVDTSLLTFMLYCSALAIIRNNLFTPWSTGSGYMDYYIFLIPFELLYYLLFEGVFRMTPGKYLTGTIVIDAEGNKAGLGRIIKRTLSRFIPFDALTFLKGDAIGWHDSISHSYVAKSITITEDDNTVPS
ncbi:RDD family protein [Ferruginibacter albus]|uniref:RDD family protein n=1 Tax=Ferruginibacter albus TaxID=2875540 RepID=UPI001CC45D80|nr:RDD family protein [Ferruginibacter albus]UAY51780.1 RDD family protein [Ferruginibacter albus]